jgi:cyclopropane fatty-acyl-phospholipid synthase-like methyltransferase
MRNNSVAFKKLLTNMDGSVPFRMNMKNYLPLFLLAITSMMNAQDPWKDVYKESAWADRDSWQKPEELIKQLQLVSGSQVADIGCHEGYMTFKLAKAVGKNGKVFAVDVTQYKLDKLQEHAKTRKAENIKTIKGDYDDPKLPINALDAVIIMDAYHEMDDHDKILQHIKASLKSGGRLVLCEPISEARKDATRDEQEGKHELGMSFALEDLKKAGFTIIRQQNPFLDRKDKGDKMWMVVARK